MSSELDFLRDPPAGRWVVCEELLDGTVVCYGPFHSADGALEHAWDVRHEGAVNVWVSELREP